MRICAGYLDIWLSDLSNIFDTLYTFTYANEELKTANDFFDILSNYLPRVYKPV